MKYFKKYDSNNKLIIGTCEEINTEEEITKDEYLQLHQYIKENAVHIENEEE